MTGYKALCCSVEFRLKNFNDEFVSIIIVNVMLLMNDTILFSRWFNTKMLCFYMLFRSR